MTGTSLVTIDSASVPVPYVTMRLGATLLGVEMSAVRDVLRYLPPSPVPLGHPMVLGVMNLRGRLATVVDTRLCAGMPPAENPASGVIVVVEDAGERYALRVDKIAEVAELAPMQRRPLPENMATAVQAIASGIFRLEKEEMVSLDPAKLIAYIAQAQAAAA